jgi:hypothetical protein
MSEERNDGGNPPGDDIELSDDFDEPEVDELEADDEERDSDREEAPPDEEPEAKPQPQRRDRGRRERQAAALRQQREKVDRLERELQQVRQASQAPRIDPYEQQRRDTLEREQISLLPPDQQSLYWVQKSEQRVAQALQQQRAELSDTIERSSWEQSCRSDPMRRRYSDKVESTLNSYAPGQVRPPREVVFRYLLGEDVERKRASDNGRQRSQAARRVRDQTTQPGNGRSDAPRERTAGNSRDDNSLEALRRRVYGSGRPLW